MDGESNETKASSALINYLHMSGVHRSQGSPKTGSTVNQTQASGLWVFFLTTSLIGLVVFASGDVFNSEERRVAQAVEHSAVKVWIFLHGGSILHDGRICSL